MVMSKSESVQVQSTIYSKSFVNQYDNVLNHPKQNSKAKLPLNLNPSRSDCKTFKFDRAPSHWLNSSARAPVPQRLNAWLLKHAGGIFHWLVDIREVSICLMHKNIQDLVVVANGTSLVIVWKNHQVNWKLPLDHPHSPL
eukprot:jgi/Psemu1/30375/gm1.30375_g